MIWRYPPVFPNIAGWKMDPFWIGNYAFNPGPFSYSKWGIFQPAMLGKTGGVFPAWRISFHLVRRDRNYGDRVCPPNELGLWDPLPNMAFSWLINGCNPNYLRILGWTSNEIYIQSDKKTSWFFVFKKSISRLVHTSSQGDKGSCFFPAQISKIFPKVYLRKS